MATQQLTTNSSQDPPQPKDPSTPQASAANLNKPSQTSVERLRSELDALDWQVKEVEDRTDSKSKKIVRALRSQINYRKRRIQAEEMGLRKVPIRMLRKSQRETARTERKLERKIVELESKRDGAQNTDEKTRFSTQLRQVRCKMNKIKDWDAVMKQIEEGKDPREGERKTVPKTTSSMTEEAAKLEIEIDKEKNEIVKKRLKAKWYRLRYQINKANGTTNKNRHGTGIASLAEGIKEAEMKLNHEQDEAQKKRLRRKVWRLKRLLKKATEEAKMRQPGKKEQNADTQVDESPMGSADASGGKVENANPHAEKLEVGGAAEDFGWDDMDPIGADFDYFMQIACGEFDVREDE
ncbi:hypothetical protein H0H93_010297 [Arthromyces matolae]|nr:hypothetical protein H0H93_010297 [Arthromyces matolae]